MVGAGAVSIVIAAMLRPFLPKLPIFRRFILTQTNDGKIQAAGTPLHAGEDVWPFVGTVGVALTDLRPGGLVQFPFANDLRNAPVVSVSGFANERREGRGSGSARKSDCGADGLVYESREAQKGNRGLGPRLSKTLSTAT